MRERALQAWVLWCVLVAQTVLTLPWLWRTAPFTDEALYLSAGHQEWSHWLHATALPDYASWFSGAPVLYPPLGALADSLGGLAAARALSLVFMLGATSCVYLAATRLFGQQAGLFASAVFAVSGLVVHNGAFATYNPLAMFLLAAGLWAGVRASDGSYGWLAGCAAALAMANAAKYATLAWDPVVMGVAFLHAWPRGAAEALRRGFSLAMTLAFLDLGLLACGGLQYFRGVMDTTVARTIHFGTTSPPSAILARAAIITGLIVVLALAGVLMSIVLRATVVASLRSCCSSSSVLSSPLSTRHTWASWAHSTRTWVSVCSSLLSPPVMDAARSSDGQASGCQPHGWHAGAACGCLLVAILITGRIQTVQFRGPSTTVATQLVSTISHGYKRGTYILSDGAARMEQYYLPQIPFHSWLGIFDPTAATQAAYENRICSDAVSLVILRLSHKQYDHPYDSRVERLLGRTGKYRLVITAGQGNYATQVWQLEPGSAGEAAGETPDPDRDRHSGSCRAAGRDPGCAGQPRCAAASPLSAHPRKRGPGGPQRQLLPAGPCHGTFRRSGHQPADNAVGGFVRLCHRGTARRWWSSTRPSSDRSPGSRPHKLPATGRCRSFR